MFILLFLVGLLLTAWAVSRAARAVGSPRGRFRVGLIAAILISLINILASAAVGIYPAKTAAAGMMILTVALLAQLLIDFVIVRKIFDLDSKPALAPMGAFVATQLLL